MLRARSTVLSWLALFIATACMVTLLTDYAAVWEQPENIVRHQEILSSPDADLRETMLRSFDWEVMEAGAPRLTRLLSNALDVADFRFRTWFHRAVFPHPSVSLAWLFGLGLTPLVIFLTFREIWRSSTLARYGVALYLSLPSTASLATMHFRSGKSVAVFCMALLCHLLVRIASARLGGRPPGETRRLQMGICVVFLTGLFADEIGFFSLLAILLLQDYRTHLRSALALSGAAVAVTAAYALFVATLLPELHSLAGFPVDCSRHCQDDRYTLLDRVVDTISFRQDTAYYADLGRLFAINAWYAVRDLTGIWNLGNAESGAGRAFGIFNATALAAIAAVAVFAARTMRPGDHGTHPALRLPAFALLFVCALAFHAVLMSVTEHPRWGIYWYGVFVGVPFLLLAFGAIHLIAQQTRISPLVGGGVCIVVVLGNFDNFVSTNYAYKDYHYYPRRAKFLSEMFSSNEKFALARERYRRFDLRDATAEFEKLRKVPDLRVKIPLELRYLLVQTRFCPWTHDYYHVLETDTSSISVTCFSSFLTRLSDDLRQQRGSATATERSADPTGIYDDGGTAMSRSKAYVSPARDGGLLAVNGRGQRSALEYDVGKARVHAIDWKLDGRYDGTAIRWSNGTTWERNDTLPAEFERLFPGLPLRSGAASPN